MKCQIRSAGASRGWGKLREMQSGQHVSVSLLRSWISSLPKSKKDFQPELIGTCAQPALGLPVPPPSPWGALHSLPSHASCSVAENLAWILASFHLWGLAERTPCQRISTPCLLAWSWNSSCLFARSWNPSAGSSFRQPQRSEGVLSAGSINLQPSLLISPLTFWGNWQRGLQMAVTWSRALGNQL